MEKRAIVFRRWWTDLHEKPLASNRHTFHYDSLAGVLTGTRDTSGHQQRGRHGQYRHQAVGSYLMWWITFYQLNSCCPVRSCKVQYFPDQRNCIEDIQDTSVEYSHTCFVGPYCLGFNCFIWKCFMLNYNLREYNLTISCIGSSVQHSLRHIQPLLS